MHGAKNPFSRAQYELSKTYRSLPMRKSLALALAIFIPHLSQGGSTQVISLVDQGGSRNCQGWLAGEGPQLGLIQSRLPERVGGAPYLENFAYSTDSGQAMGWTTEGGWLTTVHREHVLRVQFSAPHLVRAELLEISPDGRWALLQYRGEEEIFSLVDMEEAHLSLEWGYRATQGRSKFYFLNSHLLLETHEGLGLVRVYALNKGGADLISSATLPEVSSVIDGPLADLFMAGPVTWSPHLDEAQKTICLSTLGRVDQPVVQCLHLLSGRLRKGPLIPLPILGPLGPLPLVKPSRGEAARLALSHSGPMPIDAATRLLSTLDSLDAPHEISRVRWSPPSTLDYVTNTIGTGPHALASLRQFDLWSRHLRQELRFPGMRIHSFAWSPHRDRLVVWGPHWTGQLYRDKPYLFGQPPHGLPNYEPHHKVVILQSNSRKHWEILWTIEQDQLFPMLPGEAWTPLITEALWKSNHTLEFRNDRFQFRKVHLPW